MRIDEVPNGLGRPFLNLRDVFFGARREITRIDDERLALPDDDGGVPLGEGVWRVFVANETEQHRAKRAPRLAMTETTTLEPLDRFPRRHGHPPCRPGESGRDARLYVAGRRPFR